VRRLTLTDFRNYASLRLEPDPEPIVLTGANGAGKTNLLEAVSYLVPGRGLRAASLDNVVRIGASSWAVAARVEAGADSVEIGTGFALGDAGRSARIDREPSRSLAALGERVRALWLTPAMDGLFTGSPGDRRRFLDRLVLTLDSAHAARVADFERTMRQRNRLLEEDRPDRRWLGGIEAQMAALGVAIAAARCDAVHRLSALLAARAGGVFPDPGLSVDGALERDVLDHAAVDVEVRYARTLADGRSADSAAGRTLSGPHRSDLQVLHRGRDVPAALASTGEQKGLLIALVLGHARLVADLAGGVAPLLLLDEIAAHLDDMRRAALFAEISALGAQAWMTGTDRALFADIADQAQPFEVSGGAVAPW
jgi:DNA replication and repair protein RecF